MQNLTKIVHIRRVSDQNSSKFLPTGGATMIIDIDEVEGTQIIKLGMSVCNLTDHYNKRIGRNIALGQFETDPIILDLPEGVTIHKNVRECGTRIGYSFEGEVSNDPVMIAAIEQLNIRIHEVFMRKLGFISTGIINVGYITLNDEGDKTLRPAMVVQPASVVPDILLDFFMSMRSMKQVVEVFETWFHVRDDMLEGYEDNAKKHAKALRQVRTVQDMEDFIAGDYLHNQ